MEICWLQEVHPETLHRRPEARIGLVMAHQNARFQSMNSLMHMVPPAAMLLLWESALMITSLLGEKIAPADMVRSRE